MNKIFKLKKWLLLKDAARYLSNIFEDEVTNEDIVQLVTDDMLPLYWKVNNRLVHEVEYTISIMMSPEDTKKHQDTGEKPAIYYEIEAQIEKEPPPKPRLILRPHCFSIMGETGTPTRPIGGICVFSPMLITCSHLHQFLVRLRRENPQVIKKLAGFFMSNSVLLSYKPDIDFYCIISQRIIFKTK